MLNQSHGVRSLKVACGIACVALSASAEAAVWTGAVDHLWTNSGNWSGVAPTQFGVQPIVFASAGAGNLTTNVNVGGSFFVSDISTNSTASSFTIANTSGGLLCVSGDIYINSGASTLNAAISYPIFFNKVANTTLSFDINGAGRSLAATSVERHSVASLRSGQTVIKNGTGLLSFSGTSTYHGETQVNAGTLLVNGTHNFGTLYRVNTGGKLGGTGSINSTGVNVNAGGTIDPGIGIGTLSTSSLTLANSTSTFAAQLDIDATPAADLLNVTGSVSLGGGVLDLTTINAGGGAFPRTYLIIANDGTDAVSGTFGSIVGLNPAYSVTVNTSFIGTDVLGRVGTGNDVAVTIVIPEPAALGVIASTGLLVLRRRAAAAK